MVSATFMCSSPRSLELPAWAGLLELLSADAVLGLRTSCTTLPALLARVADWSYAAWTSVPPVSGSDVSLTKSKQLVADHGEVFTPDWLVEDMLNLVKGESERIDARFLEPACGSGNFLIPVLQRKLAPVEQRFSGSDFEKRHHALLALMCCCSPALNCCLTTLPMPQHLLDTLFRYLGHGVSDEWYRAAQVVVEANIVQGATQSV